MQSFNQINLKLLFLLLLFTGSFQYQIHSQTGTDNVENFLLGKMRKRKIPGLQIAVVRSGKIVFQSIAITRLITFCSARLSTKSAVSRLRNLSGSDNLKLLG